MENSSIDELCCTSRRSFLPHTQKEALIQILLDKDVLFLLVLAFPNAALPQPVML